LAHLGIKRIEELPDFNVLKNTPVETEDES